MNVKQNFVGNAKAPLPKGGCQIFDLTGGFLRFAEWINPFPTYDLHEYSFCVIIETAPFFAII